MTTGWFYYFSKFSHILTLSPIEQTRVMLFAAWFVFLFYLCKWSHAFCCVVFLN